MPVQVYVRKKHVRRLCSFRFLYMKQKYFQVFTITINPIADTFVVEDNKKLTAFEDPTGITVCIQLAKNKPREDISVFLVLANSRKSEVITHFLFQPVVSKVRYDTYLHKTFYRILTNDYSQDCRLKLQPSSKTELPPYNPYIPMDTIVQIMLIASLKRVGTSKILYRKHCDLAKMRNYSFRNTFP